MGLVRHSPHPTAPPRVPARPQNKALSDDDRRNMASAVVLAALAIPVSGPAGGAAAAAGGPAGGTGLDFDTERDKKSKLAGLLRHPGIPSREALLADIAAKGVVRLVRPDVAALYALLEKGFDPLALVARARPLLAALRAATGATVASTGTLGGGSGSAANTLSQYAAPLERLVVFRLVEQVRARAGVCVRARHALLARCPCLPLQLSAVYSTVRLAHFRELVAGLTLSFNDVEKLIVRCVKNRQLAVRVDHRNGARGEQQRARGCGSSSRLCAPAPQAASTSATRASRRPRRGAS